MSGAPLEEQQVYFYNCIDPNFLIEFKHFITENMPIFGENSCMSLLDTHFCELYPTFIHHLGFWQMHPPSGEQFSVFTSPLKYKANKADLDSIAKDNILVFHYLLACDYHQLLNLLLNASTPNLSTYNGIITSYE